MALNNSRFTKETVLIVGLRLARRTATVKLCLCSMFTAWLKLDCGCHNMQPSFPTGPHRTKLQECPENREKRPRLQASQLLLQCGLDASQPLLGSSSLAVYRLCLRGARVQRWQVSCQVGQAPASALACALRSVK